VETETWTMAAPVPGLPGPDTPSGESILVVDDDPFIARLLEIELRAAGYEVRTASDGEKALEIVRQGCPDLILADVMMPNMDGYELTRRLRLDARTATVSVILLTARGLSADKLEGFSVGADDYIVKPFDTPELLARIRGVLRRAKEMRAQSPLTGLPGNIRIEEEIEKRVASDDLFAILYADLDHFKAYNDHYGFTRGDEAIQHTARLIQDLALAVGGMDIFVGHVGGDDFVVVCNAEHAVPIAERIVEKFERDAPGLYDPEDAERGFIEVVNRRGETQRFPFLSLSIGIASTAHRKFEHYAQAVAIATEMKTFTKGTPGSSWAVDRRTT
jgi:diguanylate cyclase (GGDEF)-like protein